MYRRSCFLFQQEQAVSGRNEEQLQSSDRRQQPNEFFWLVLAIIGGGGVGTILWLAFWGWGAAKLLGLF
jgi:hypothetical protein